jgi:hypothetical protein
MIDFDITTLKQEVAKELIQLLRKKTISKEEVSHFLIFSKSQTAPKTWKLMKKLLQQKLKDSQPPADSHTPGPIIKDKEISYFQDKISQMSSYGIPLEYQGDEINFYICGSLVTGYCSNPRKSNFGIPSDYKRISDVDILVIISNRLFDSFFSLHQEAVVIIKGEPRSLPLGYNTNPSINFIPSFLSLLSLISDIAFAGRTEREVHFVFIPEKSFKGYNIKKEPHLFLGKKVI